MRIRWKTQGRYKKAWRPLSLLLPTALLVGAATAQAEGTTSDLPSDPAKKELQAQIESGSGLTPRGRKALFRARTHQDAGRFAESAEIIGQWLEGHPAVSKTLYPGLESHPQHDLAMSQMNGQGGGIISIDLKGGFDAARRMLEGCQLFSLAESLGGVESLINHPAIMTHASVPVEKRAKLGISDSLVRLSVGIEDVGDLITELDQVL